MVSAKAGGIKIEIETKRMNKKLLKLLGNWDIKNWTPILKAAARDFRKKKRGMFRKKNRRYFKPLSPQYAKQKRKKWGFAYPMLVANGNLMRSIIHARNKDAITKISNARSGNPTLEIGSDNSIIKYHEKGGDNLPQRPVLYWGPEKRGFPDLGLPRKVSNTIKERIAKELGLKKESIKGAKIIIRAA